MKRELKARLERLGPIPAINRARSGSPVNLILRPDGALAKVKAIDATGILARRGVSVVKAKRTIETMVEHGEVRVHVPTVENIKMLSRELKVVGVRAAQIAGSPVDPRKVREKLGLTQEQFALRYGLDLDTVQNWEQGRTKPDKASAAYLRVIARQPDEAAAAQVDE
jgi:DNA-binding transcriptional regulator YiaG